ncbi:MAG: hypothetical protein IT320_13590 [Anaerolineae bacterium]|nr:hypothetical protein [Anaerolineae bacterium]
MRLIALVFALIVLVACASPTEMPVAQVAVSPDRLLEYGGAQADALQPGYAEQDWLFVAQASDAIQLTLDTREPLSLILSTAEGQTVAEGNSIMLLIPSDGTYRARVTRQDTSGTALYTLALSSVVLETATETPTPTLPATATSTPTATTTPTATPIYAALGTFLGRLASGQSLVGRFEHAGETQVVTFEATAGQYLYLRLQPLSDGTDPALALFDSQGNLLISDEESGGADTPLFDHLPLPQTDTYIVQMRVDASGGDYQLEFRLDAQADTFAPPTAIPTQALDTLVTAPVSNDSVLRDHRPSSGQIERSGDYGRFTIDGHTNDVLTVAVHAAGDAALRPAFEIYDPDGALLQRVEAPAGSGIALAPAVLLPRDGIFSVFVLGLGETTGAFTIAYGLDGSYTDNLKTFAAADVPAQATLPEPGVRDVWYAALNAGDVITAAVIAESGGFDPALELATLDGVRIAYDDSGTQNPVIQQATIPNTGTYLLRVTGANASSAGSYSLTWRYLTTAPTPTPPPTIMPLMSIDDELMPGVIEEYAFLGQVGQRVRITVMAAGATQFDPRAAVVAPDGTVLIEVDDSGGDLNPQFDLDLPTAGVYQLRVSSYDETGGAFIARVERLTFD